MLGEFNGFSDKIKALILQAKDVVSNDAVDTLDLSVLEDQAESLAGQCFVLNHTCRPTVMMAQKEAYDAITSHNRLLVTFEHDRAYYYARAAAEYQGMLDFWDYQKSVLLNLVEFGAL